MKDQAFNLESKIIEILAEELQEPHSHKPFMTKVPIKQTPIGYELHQICIPDFDCSQALMPSCQRKVIWGNLKLDPSVPMFLKSKTNETEVLKYISFIENYFQQKIPDYFAQVSRQRTRSMALCLLHECNYNYIKSKFYILFPYYKTYNKLRCHQPLVLSDEEMEHKINAHIDSLKSSKQNDLMKWVKTIENQMQSRIHISKINNYMDIARHNKYEIPQNIKDLIDRSVKIGRQIKKNVLNSKNTLEKLQTMKSQLQDNKIVTNEMIHFQQAVSRAQQWIKKQNKFQQQYFLQEQILGQRVFCLRQKQFFRKFGKIEYKLIQNLVNQYNSLPLNYPSFNKTTLILYEDTNKLIGQIPSLSKAAKTRKSQQSSGVVKIPRKLISQILYQIGEVPVEHQDFINFQFSITDGLEQLERISMYLQDTRHEKNIKNLNTFQKLLSDIPIENDTQRKLNQKIEYYQLIDRIRKDISNPAKYESLKDQLLRLKQKGYENVEHAKLQSRVMTCMGWHQSQQLIKQQKKIPNRCFIILNQKYVKSKIIRYENFQAQLLSARHELNISQDILKQSESRLETVSLLKQKILNIFDQQDPQLSELLQVLKQCYQNGISFLQFEQLYQKVTRILILVAKMHYLLSTSQQLMVKNGQKFYFSFVQMQKIIDFIYQKSEVKDLKTKQAGDQIISTITQMIFPIRLFQWIAFTQFMRKAKEWSDRAMKIIQDFKNNDNLYNTRDVIQQSRYCLHSKHIQEELNKIQIALKWRERIARKMIEQPINSFDTKDHQFMRQLEQHLQNQQVNLCSHDQMMFKALQYMHVHGGAIFSILQKISSYPIQKLIILKLSELNKFIKQIDRQVQKYSLEDKVIQSLKQQLQIQLLLNQDWKQRYLSIKRFEKKKIGFSKRKDQQDQNDDQLKDQKQDQKDDNYINGTYVTKAVQVLYQPNLIQRPLDLYETQKKKYLIRNGEFCWFFRILLLILEFYNATQLKFAVQEFVRLKTCLSDIYKVIEKYNTVFDKPDKSDADYEYLDAQTCKVSVFFKQSYLISTKNSQIVAWKTIAEHILKSVPVINMQLKARRVQELRQILQKQKNEQLINENKPIQVQNTQLSNKRRRKSNPLYQNSQMTTLKDEFLNPKSKKRLVKPIKPSSPIQKRISTKQAPYLQYIQSFINGDYNPQLIIDDPKQYCICRNGIPNENSLMIGCENCQEWFHIQCIGIKKHQAKNQEKYLCVACKSLMDEFNDAPLGYFWDHYAKISQYALLEVYQQGKQLGVNIPELAKITQVYNAMMKWKEQTNNLLKKLIQENPIQIRPYEQQIYPLYLQSLWLPTVHYEAAHLKKLMKHIREM